MPGQHNILDGNGEVRRLLKSCDWSKFSLSDPLSWRAPFTTVMQLMLDSGQPACLAWGMELRFFYNDAYIEVLGKKHPSALMRPFWEVWSEVRQDLEPAMERALAGESSFHSNKPLRITRQLPEETWFTYSLLPVRDDEGKVAGVFITVTETTGQVEQEQRLMAEAVRAEAAQQESEEKLREAHERYLALFNAIDQGFCTIGVAFDENQKPVDYRFLEVSPSFERQTGIRNGAGRWMRDIAPDQDQHWFDLYGGVARTGEPIRFDSYSTPLDRWWTVYAFRIQDPALRRIGVLFHDITDRKRAEEALRVSEERLRTLFDSMGEAFVITEAVVDVAGRVVDYRFIEANPAFDRHTGLGEPCGRTMHELMPELAPAWIAHHEHVQRTGEPVEFETCMAALDRWLSVSVTRVGGNGSKRLTALFSDITKRKRAEEELQEANRRKDEFLAMLAHELRNPLAPISAAAQLMDLVHLDAAQLRKTSQVIRRQVSHMTELVDDLLDVSRVTRGLVAISKTPQDLKRIVADAVEQVRPIMKGQGHHFGIELPPESAHVLGDPKRLVQLLTNLLNNAAKYTPPNGNIQLRMNVHDESVLIHVRDNGIGIAPELQTRVFDLFAQAERTADRAQGGLGLGLALVKSLAGLHDGQVSCFSEGLGKGSCFTVCLPRIKDRKSVANHREASASLLKAPKKLRVLVVDDNADAAQMLAMVLDALGHDVLVEHSPQRAVERAQAEVPDVCLIDIGLPDMDGNELARRLRSQPETTHAVLIAVTGYGQHQDRKNASAAGFNHHFVKPVDAKRLVEVLNEISTV